MSGYAKRYGQLKLEFLMERVELLADAEYWDATNSILETDRADIEAPIRDIDLAPILPLDSRLDALVDDDLFEILNMSDSQLFGEIAQGGQPSSGTAHRRTIENVRLRLKSLVDRALRAHDLLTRSFRSPFAIGAAVTAAASVVLFLLVPRSSENFLSGGTPKNDTRTPDFTMSSPILRSGERPLVGHPGMKDPEAFHPTVHVKLLQSSKGMGIDTSDTQRLRESLTAADFSACLAGKRSPSSESLQKFAPVRVRVYERANMVVAEPVGASPSDLRLLRELMPDVEQCRPLIENYRGEPFEVEISFSE